MTAMISEVYDALVEAGATQDKARRAAEAVASFDSRFARNERENVEGFADLKREIITNRGETTLLKWMVGFNLAMMVAVLFKVFMP